MYYVSGSVLGFANTGMGKRTPRSADDLTALPSEVVGRLNE